MKKTLSLLLIAGIYGYAQGQNSAPVKPAQLPYVKITQQQLLKMRLHQNDAAQLANSQQPIANSSKKHANKIQSEPNLPHLGSSFNPNSVRDATTTATTANQACGLIVMTHRDDSSKFNKCNDGAYEAAFSVNEGADWDTNVYIGCGNQWPTRYPNGAIFNPAGNINPTNCYVAMAGPYTNSAVSTNSWVETAYGSITIGDAHAHEMLWTNGKPGVSTQNNGDLSFMSSSDDSTVHVIGEGWTENAAQTNLVTWKGAVLTTGKFDAAADSFKWTQTVFRPHLVPPIVGFATMQLPYDSLAGPWGVPGTAWSQDGKIGYVVIFGNLDSVGYNFVSSQPIVYKTTNSGKNWAMMPPFDFSTLSVLTQFLIPSSDYMVGQPLWYNAGSTQGDEADYDLTVDAKGNLHIFGAVISAYYSNPDSAYEVEFFNPAAGADQKGYIYDVYTTSSNGEWQARYIDSMRTYPAVAEASENNDWQNIPANGVVPSGPRIQASRTTDGQKVFCTWLDDRSTTGVTYDSLLSPDIYGQGYDVIKRKGTRVIQFTTTHNNYFDCVSDIVLTSGSGDTTYTVPTTIAYPQSTPGDGMSPINYFYVGSVQYMDTMFTYLNTQGIPVVSAPGFSISQNYPNPFTNVTYFNVNLTQESIVKVDVYNLVGEKVYSVNAQKMSTGTHLMTINGAGWSSGIYFYRVTANDNTLTQKMVVQ